MSIFKIYNHHFFVEGEVTFQSEYAQIEEKEGGLYCSLEGQYLKNGEPFDPPLHYFMADVGVTKRNLSQIIAENYQHLKPKEELEKPKNK